MDIKLNQTIFICRGKSSDQYTGKSCSGARKAWNLFSSIYPSSVCIYPSEHLAFNIPGMLLDGHGRAKTSNHNWNLSICINIHIYIYSCMFRHTAAILTHLMHGGWGGSKNEQLPWFPAAPCHGIVNMHVCTSTDVVETRMCANVITTLHPIQSAHIGPFVSSSESFKFYPAVPTSTKHLRPPKK